MYEDIEDNGGMRRYSYWRLWHEKTLREDYEARRLCGFVAFFSSLLSHRNHRTVKWGPSELSQSDWSDAQLKSYVFVLHSLHAMSSLVIAFNVNVFTYHLWLQCLHTFLGVISGRKTESILTNTLVPQLGLSSILQNQLGVALDALTISPFLVIDDKLVEVFNGDKVCEIVKDRILSS